ncbi:MAG: BsuPI-related putative proteinase inhibitor [Candidatus Thermoplasmatota archaeon]
MHIELETDKNEYEVGEKIEAAITLVNKGDVEEEIFFNNSQRHDFVIKRENDEIWRWSKGRAFLMATGTVRLDPGEERSYTEKLNPGDLPSGEYELVGIITGEPGFRTSISIVFVEG